MSSLQSIKTGFFKLSQAYSSLFFIDSPKLGTFIALLTFLYPNIALCGLTSLLISHVILRNLSYERHPLREGIILSNSLLVGLFIGYLFRFDQLVLLFICVCSGTTLFLTLFLESYLQPQGLPILSLPFTIVTTLISLSSRYLTNLSDATVYFQQSQNLITYDSIPFLFQTFFRSIGAIYCIPDIIFGITIWVFITLRSPIIGSFLVAGFWIGYSIESAFQIQSMTLGAFHHFNYSLSFATISAVLLYPSRFSLGIGICASMIAPLITLSSLSFWNTFHLPITAIPFNITILLLMRSISSLQPFRISTHYKSDPEKTIDQSRLFILRHRGDEPRLFLPVEGLWTIQQGFDGPWTHRGFWKHGLDFYITDDNGKSFKNQGHDLTDYYAFRQAVLAPVDGYIVEVCSNLDDNPIVRVENQRNWGNYIVIRSLAGYWVVLAHLKKDSVCVALNEYVSAGKKIAECGNSGYSQEPHLHLQVQYTPGIGSHTAPFHLLNYLEKNRLHFHSVPTMNSKIESAPYNLALERVLTFRLGEKMIFTKDLSKSQITVSVALNETDGRLYLTDGQSRLYFNRIGIQFYFYGFEGNSNSFLAHLMLAGPRVPMTYKTHVLFTDSLPSELTDRVIKRWWRLWMSMFTLNSSEKEPQYRFNPDTLEIHGTVRSRSKSQPTYLRMDPIHGFQEVQIGKTRYVRKE